MKLFTYWRSQAAYRVRIALGLKGLRTEKVSLDLLAGDQFAADYQSLNPGGVVPTLIDGEGQPLVQSLAILEYLDEKYPDPPLLPKELRARAHARALSAEMHAGFQALRQHCPTNFRRPVRKMISRRKP